MNKKKNTLKFLNLTKHKLYMQVAPEYASDYAVSKQGLLCNVTYVEASNIVRASALRLKLSGIEIRSTFDASYNDSDKGFNFSKYVDTHLNVIEFDVSYVKNFTGQHYDIALVSPLSVMIKKGAKDELRSLMKKRYNITFDKVGIVSTTYGNLKHARLYNKFNKTIWPSLIKNKESLVGIDNNGDEFFDLKLTTSILII